MDRNRAKQRLEGCYITVLTMFRDPDLEVDLGATRQAVRFLIERGINAGNAPCSPAARPATSRP